MSNLDKAVEAAESVVGFETCKGSYVKNFTKYLVLAIADEIEARIEARDAKRVQTMHGTGPR